MSSLSEIELTGPQRQALWNVFSGFASSIDWVGVYGSRAQGRARPGSDVDLVVYGPIARAEEASMRMALEESDLSIFADLVAYDRIEHAPLKAQIDHWVRPLFTRDQLQHGEVARAA